MNRDLDPKKLHREEFRQPVSPPIHLPRWAAIALLCAGISLTGAACGGGSSGHGPSGQEKQPPASTATVDPTPAEPMPAPAATANPTPVATPETSPPVPTVTQDANPMGPSMDPIAQAPPAAAPAMTANTPKPLIPDLTGVPSLPNPKDPMIQFGPGGPPPVGVGLPTPKEVQKQMNRFLAHVRFCYEKLCREGKISNEGYLQIEVRFADGHFTIKSIAGALAGNTALKDCFIPHIDGKTVASSPEVINYKQYWNLPIMLMCPSQ